MPERTNVSAASGAPANHARDTVSTAVLPVAEWLERYLVAHPPPGGRLPPVRCLARLADASPATLHRALRALHQRGHLRTSPKRRGYFVPDSQSLRADSAPPALESRARSEQIALGVRSIVLHQATAADDGALTLKSVREDFACSARTASSALARLCSEKLLVRVGRRYNVASATLPGARHSRLYLAGRRPWPSEPFVHEHTLVTAVEQGLKQRGWGNLGYALSFDNTPRAIRRCCPVDHEVAGYMHLLNPDSAPWLRFFCARPRIPVTLIDYDDLDPWPAGLPTHPRMRRIGIDNTGAGTALSAHLWSLGHRHAAYFTLMPLERAYQWNVNRFEGLSRYLPDPGSGGLAGVTPFCVIADPALRIQRTDTPAPLVVDTGILADAVPQILLNRSKDDVCAVLSMKLIEDQLQSCFAAALADRRITAWVGMNDFVAAVACHWLGRNGVSVPGDISVAGFDNVSFAWHMGITTCDFGSDAIGRLAVNLLAQPSAAPVPAKGCRCVDATLIVRHSTGPR